VKEKKERMLTRRGVKRVNSSRMDTKLKEEAMLFRKRDTGGSKRLQKRNSLVTHVLMSSLMGVGNV
jgi:hypothetical protein